MNGSSPIRDGFGAIHRNPAIAAIEIAWRWSFGLIATILLLLGSRAFLSGLQVSKGDTQALRGNDPTMIAAALMHILQQEGVLQRFFAIMAAVAIPSAIVWIAAATLGRVATLKRLAPGPDVNAKAILGLNIARAASLFAAVISWYMWTFFCAILTTRPGATNYPLYLFLSMISLPVIAIIWGLLNWVLSLAPLLAVGEGTSARKLYGDAVAIIRLHRGRFASISSWLGLPRLAAMVIAVIVAVIVLIASSSVLVSTAALTMISLAYCAFADYLYVVRLAAYAQIARELPIATAASPP